MDEIYLDNNATTRPAPEVAEAMIPMLKESFGNPSSAHVVGQRASFHVSEARRQVASCLGADPSEIVFTSGGTESDNLAILGLLKVRPQKRHIVTTTVEHEAVFQLVQRLEDEGYQATYLCVDEAGRIDLDQFRAALREDTALASIMFANNETGVLFPLEQIAEICREANVPLHTDAVQTLGKVRIDVGQLGVDLLSLSAHKFHGPKGVGALYVRNPLRISSQMVGGQQERDIRGGTENVPGIVGLGVAAALIEHEVEDLHNRMRDLRDQLEQRICEQVPSAKIIGHDSPRLPNTSLICFEGLSAQDILMGLSERGICASGGSACHSGSLEPSRVLLAMGIERNRAISAVRFSLSRYSSPDEIDRLLTELQIVIAKIGTPSTAST